MLHLEMLLQDTQRLNEYKLVIRVNKPENNSQDRVWSFEGNVKALLKLNVDNYLMEKVGEGL